MALRYYDMRDYYLAITPRVASSSLREWMIKHGVTVRYGREHLKAGQPIYGIIRGPIERARSGYRLLNHKFGPLPMSVIMDRFRENGHIKGQVELHSGRVQKWMLFEEFLPQLGKIHNHDGSELKQMEYNYDWEYDGRYSYDYDARNAAVSNLFDLETTFRGWK